MSLVDNLNFMVTAPISDTNTIERTFRTMFFANNPPEEIYFTTAKFSGTVSLDAVVDTVVAACKYYYGENDVLVQTEFRGVDVAYISVYEKGQPVLFLAVEDEKYNPSSPKASEKILRNIELRVSGSRKDCMTLASSIDSFNEEKAVIITWYYSTGNNFSQREFVIEKPKPVHDEFYPWFKTGVDDYIKTYLESDESILILLGEPGTGKTSFIRNMVYKNNLNTMFTYDAKLLETDSFFVEFFQSDENILLVEDADVFLTKRNKTDNVFMSKMLNISDGIVKLFNKKIVFTANITDIGEIDEALIRAGRCFDVVNFRPLSFEEAKAAANVAGTSEPEKNKNYTLAELFNEHKNKVNNAIPKKFGFK